MLPLQSQGLVGPKEAARRETPAKQGGTMGASLILVVREAFCLFLADLVLGPQQEVLS